MAHLLENDSVPLSSDETATGQLFSFSFPFNWRTVWLYIFFCAPLRVPLKRHKSLRNILRERGQLAEFWRTHKLDMIQYTEDCSVFQDTSEPLLNYLDVSDEQRQICTMGCRKVAAIKETHSAFVLMEYSKYNCCPHSIQHNKSNNNIAMWHVLSACIARCWIIDFGGSLSNMSKSEYIWSNPVLCKQKIQ